MEFKLRKSLVKCPHVLVIILTIVALPKIISSQQMAGPQLSSLRNPH